MQLRVGLALLAGAMVLGTGCRFKSGESYMAATVPNSTAPYVMDPYSYGGVSYATGGLRPNMSYGTGARGDLDGDPKFLSEMAARMGDKPNWTVEGDPVNEKSGQFLPPAIGRVKDNPASPFGTLSGY